MPRADGKIHSRMLYLQKVLKQCNPYKEDVSFKQETEDTDSVDITRSQLLDDYLESLQ